MQQRLNNRWLSEQLLETVAAYSLAPETSPKTGVADASRHRTPPAPQGQRHRRTWQRLATALLLMGSAAFSYLAWSQSEFSVHAGAGSRAGSFFSGSRSDTGSDAKLDAQSDAQIRSTETLRLKQASVRALRVQNRELMQSIATLQQRIDPTHTPLPD